jgi:hypothetical protein
MKLITETVGGRLKRRAISSRLRSLVPRVRERASV